MAENSVEGESGLLRMDSLSRPSLLLVRAGCLADLRTWPDSRLPAHHAVVVTDTNVGNHYLGGLMATLDGRFPLVQSITIPAGEESKSVEMALRLWEQLVEFRATRETVIVALGGGVVGDLAGFVAATYMRGLPLIQIPTSLLAQVDSSIGGKTGINLPEGKNLVGAFWQPDLVLIDPHSLRTLPDREYRSGLAEIVKYGMILDGEFLSLLEDRAGDLLARDPDCLAGVIMRCCRIKASVVERDETDRSGQRALLNYGHTFGHAIESVSGYGTWLHGEAVAAGMELAGNLAFRMGMLPLEAKTRQNRLLSQFGLPGGIPLPDPAALLDAMCRDKKRTAARPRLIVSTGAGQGQQVDWPGDEVVLEVLAEGLGR